MKEFQIEYGEIRGRAIRDSGIEETDVAAGVAASWLGGGIRFGFVKRDSSLRMCLQV